MLRVAVLSLEIMGHHRFWLIAPQQAHQMAQDILLAPGAIGVVHTLIVVILKIRDIGIAAHAAVP